MMRRSGASRSVNGASAATASFNAATVNAAQKLAEFAKKVTEVAIAFVKFVAESASAEVALRGNLEAILGSAAAAEQLDQKIKQLAATLPLPISKIEELAKGLALAGLRGAELDGMLKTLAEVGSVSEEAASKLQGLIEKVSAAGKFDVTAKALKGTGISIQEVYRALAEQTGKSMAEIERMVKAGQISVEEGIKAIQKAAQTKFGPAIEKQMLPLSVQFAKFREDLAELFTGIDMEPFLKGLRSILQLFSQSTASGQALREIASGIFGGLFKAASAVFPYIKAFMKGMIFGFLQVYIALKPIGNAFMKVFGGKPNASLLDFIAMAGKGFAYLASAVAVFVSLFVGAAATFAIYGAMAAAIVAGILAAFSWLVNGVGSAVGAVKGFFGDFVGAGQNLVRGLVQGITGSAGAVIAAVIGCAKDAIKAAMHILGIGSPSRVFAQIGVNTVAGFANAVNDNSGKAAHATSDMAGAATEAAEPNRFSASSVKSAAKGGGQKIVYIEHLQLGGGGGDRSGWTEFREFLTAEFQMMEHAGEVA